MRAAVAATTNGPGRRAAPTERSRHVQARPTTSNAVKTAGTAARTTVESNQETPPARSTSGAAVSDTTTRLSRSAARRVTVVAVAGATGIEARRTTDSTRNGSPNRKGRMWLPASATWMPAQACPKDSPGRTRCHAHDRSANAPAKARRAIDSEPGSLASSLSARPSAAPSTPTASAVNAAMVATTTSTASQPRWLAASLDIALQSLTTSPVRLGKPVYTSTPCASW